MSVIREAVMVDLFFSSYCDGRAEKNSEQA